MVIDKYVVVGTDGSGLYHEVHDDYEAALGFVNSSTDKMLIVKIEGICADAYPPATISVEDHT